MFRIFLVPWSCLLLIVNGVIRFQLRFQISVVWNAFARVGVVGIGCHRKILVFWIVIPIFRIAFVLKIRCLDFIWLFWRLLLYLHILPLTPFFFEFFKIPQYLFTVLNMLLSSIFKHFRLSLISIAPYKVIVFDGRDTLPTWQMITRQTLSLLERDIGVVRWNRLLSCDLVLFFISNLFI